MGRDCTAVKVFEHGVGRGTRLIPIAPSMSIIAYAVILRDMDPQGTSANKGKTERQCETAQEGVVFKAIDKAVHTEIPCFA